MGPSQIGELEMTPDWNLKAEICQNITGIVCAWDH